MENKKEDNTINKTDLDMMYYKTNLVINYLIEESEGKITPTKERDNTLKNLTNKQLYSLFEREDFYKLPKTLIYKIVGEVNERISAKLSIPACYIGGTKSRKSQMCYKIDGNKIFVNYKMLSSVKEKYLDSGLLCLFDILRETYHSCQTNNVRMFLKGEKYNEDMINSTIQDYVNAIDKYYSTKKYVELSVDSNKYSPNYKKVKFGLDEVFKQTNFLELEADMFATNTMLKFLEKGFLTNEEYVYNMCYSVIDSKKFYYDAFAVKQALSLQRSINEMKYAVNNDVIKFDLEKFPKISELESTKNQPDYPQILRICNLIQKYDVIKNFESRYNKLNDLCDELKIQTDRVNKTLELENEA